MGSKPLGRLGVALVVAESTSVQTVSSLVMLALPAIAPKLAAALGLPPALVGVQISMAYGGGMVTSLMAGTLVRRWGAIRTSQAALLMAAAFCLTVTTGSLPLMAVGAVLLGFGYGLINPAASHMLMQASHPANRNLIFSIKQTGVPLGGALAGLILPPLALAWDWQAALWAVALVTVLLALALHPARRTWDHDRDPRARLRGTPLVGLGTIWRDPGLRRLSLAAFGFASVQLSVSAFVVTMLVTELHWTLVEAGLLLSALQVAGAVGRVTAGGAADRWLGGSRTLAAFGGATALLCLAVGLMGPGWPLAAVAAVLVPLGATSLGWNGVYLAEIARTTPPDRISLVTGASLFFNFAGVLIGPTAFAALHGLTGSTTATFAMAALPAMAGALLLTWKHPTSQG